MSSNTGSERSTGSSTWRVSPAKRAARPRPQLNGVAANVVYDDMVKPDGNAELAALIADLSGLLGRPGEEAAAGQLGGTTTRTILNDVRANVSLMTLKHSETELETSRW